MEAVTGGVQGVLKGYLRNKTITSKNKSSEVQLKVFFYFVGMLCFVLKIFKFLYFKRAHNLPDL